jgi:hypothetical protein
LTSGNLCTFITDGGSYCQPIEEDTMCSNQDLSSPYGGHSSQIKPNTSFKEFKHPLFKQIPFNPKKTRELEPETVEMLSPKE